MFCLSIGTEIEGELLLSGGEEKDSSCSGCELVDDCAWLLGILRILGGAGIGIDTASVEKV